MYGRMVNVQVMKFKLKAYYTYFLIDIVIFVFRFTIILNKNKSLFQHILQICRILREYLKVLLMHIRIIFFTLLKT